MRGIAVSTSNLDEARTVLGQHFYSNFVDVLSPSTALTARLAVAPLGRVTVGDLRMGADVRVKFGELGAYHVDVPLSGRLVWRQGHDGSQLADVDTAAVFQPAGDTVLERWDGDCRLLAVKVDCDVLERQLSRMIDGPVAAAPVLSPQLGLSRGAGASWARLVGLLADSITDPEAIAHHPLVGDQFQEAVISGLLLATNHQYRGQLDRQTGPLPAPRAIRRAVDALQAGPQRPWTSALLADTVGISQRSLQEGFQRYVGSSPLRYLKDVRLARAHDDLAAADPSRETVAKIASRWGFLHLGRFAAAYRERYGVRPSESLRF
jgi:AraC-like DNA-binding protein